MRPTPVVTISILSLLLIACGGGGEEPAPRISEDGGASATSSSEPRPSATEDATEEGTREAASTADADPCAEARVDETATFTFHDELPFQFEHPAGWDYLARTGPSQMAGSLAHLGHTGRRSSTGSIQYVFAREASSNPEGMRQIFEQSMEPIATVVIGGRDVTVFASPDPRVVNAKFLYPDADGMHSASFIFGSSSESCVEERRRVRELVLGSISARE